MSQKQVDESNAILEKFTSIAHDAIEECERRVAKFGTWIEQMTGELDTLREAQNKFAEHATNWQKLLDDPSFHGLSFSGFGWEENFVYESYLAEEEKNNKTNARVEAAEDAKRLAEQRAAVAEDAKRLAEQRASAAEARHKAEADARIIAELRVEALEKQLEDAKREAEDAKEAQKCNICLDRPKCVANIPCGHICSCLECTFRQLHEDWVLPACPICRANVEGTQRVFL